MTTETFDAFALGNHLMLSSAFGTWTGPDPGFNIHEADQYGAAGGTGNYIAVGNESGQDLFQLTLRAPRTYLGFWLSAIDPGNGNIVEFYSGDALVKRFDSITDNFPLRGPWAGNPNPDYLGMDGFEAFAYLNFNATDGTTFDKVLFLEIPGGGFEMDNVSILLPEPAGALLVGLGGCLLAIRRTIRPRPHCS